MLVRLLQVSNVLDLIESTCEFSAKLTLLRLSLYSKAASSIVKTLAGIDILVSLE